MGSFVPSNVSICDILKFAGKGKYNTSKVNGDTVYCTRVSMETGACPFTHDLSSLRSSPGGW